MSEESALTAGISNIQIQNIQPLNGRIMTKAQQVSAVGYVSDQKVKIYSMASEAQVRLRVSMTELPGGIHLPPVVAAENNVVAESWIDGVSGVDVCKADLDHVYEKLTNYMVARRSAPTGFTSPEEEGSFDYLDYLNDRVLPWSFISNIGNFLQVWARQREDNRRQLVRQLSHPDLSLANIVVSNTDGKIYVVDNELLHIGYGGFLDFNNSALNGVTANPERHDEDFRRFHDFSWSLRLLGSALIDGNLRKAEEITTCLAS